MRKILSLVLALAMLLTLAAVASADDVVTIKLMMSNTQQTGVSAAVEAFNESSSYPARLAISRGVARHIPGQDSSFRDVFARADEAMYEEKREYYRAMACHDRRRSRA